MQAQPGVTGSPGLSSPSAASMVTTVPGTTALVLDSPHSGTRYPDDFGSACDLPTLRRAEDTHVEKIYAFAPALGVAWVEAHFPRIYLDANRDTTELDTRQRPGAYDGAALVRTTVLATGPEPSPSRTIAASCTGGSGARW